MGAGGRAAGRLAVIGYRGKSSEFPPEALLKEKVVLTLFI